MYRRVSVCIRVRERNREKHFDGGSKKKSVFVCVYVLLSVYMLSGKSSLLFNVRAGL